MGLFDKKTEISKLLERFVNGQSEVDAAEFVQLNELIAVNPSGHLEAGKSLKSLLKHGDSQVQSKSIDLIKLLLDNGGNNMHQILDKETGLLDRLTSVANKGEARPQAKAREFLKLIGNGNDLTPVKSQTEENPVAQHALGYNLAGYRHAQQKDSLEPGNLEVLIPFIHEKKAPYEHIQPEEIEEVPNLIAVGQSVLDHLKEAGPHHKISSILVDNAQTVRNRTINVLHNESIEKPEALFKLHDELHTTIPNAAKYIK